MIGKPANKKQEELFEIIIIKFLINLPYEEKKEQARLSFHAEKAWYYYLDAVLEVKDDADMSREKMYQFFEKLRIYSPRSLNINPDIIMTKLSENKPTCGAIILNQSLTKVLIIKNRSQQLGFPKGKWNQSQKPQECAAREVYEQIGIYLHTRIDPLRRIQFLNNEFIPSIFFVVNGVKESEKLTIDKKEIQQVFWMSINDVTKYQKRFVRKSRDAWKIFLDEFNEPKLRIEEFIDYYIPKDNQKKKSKQKKQIVNSEKQIKNLEQIKQHQNKLPVSQAHINPQEKNPFLNFKFDTQKLMSVFAK